MPKESLLSAAQPRHPRYRITHATFPGLGGEVCEVHHRLALATASEAVETHLEDLAVLCANCHRAIRGSATRGFSWDRLKPSNQSTLCPVQLILNVRSEIEMGKKRKARGPRRNRMSKPARLDSARATRWVENYTGKNIVRGYRNWYGVDEMAAVIELRELGVAIPAERETALREKAARRSVTAAGRKQRKKKERDWIEEYPDSDDTFAYIAGYTSAGFPYGTTWEEMGESPPWAEAEESEQANPCDAERAADVPF